MIPDSEIEAFFVLLKHELDEAAGPILEEAQQKVDAVIRKAVNDAAAKLATTLTHEVHERKLVLTIDFTNLDKQDKTC